MALLFELDDKNLGQLLSEVQQLQVEIDALEEQIKSLKAQKNVKVSLHKKRVNDAIKLSNSQNIVS